MAGGERRHRLDRDFLQKRVERGLVARLGEKIGDRLGDDRPDPFDRGQVLPGVRRPRGFVKVSQSP